MTPEEQRIYDAAKAKALDEGLPVSISERQARDAVARHRGGGTPNRAGPSPTPTPTTRRRTATPTPTPTTRRRTATPTPTPTGGVRNWLSEALGGLVFAGSRGTPTPSPTPSPTGSPSYYYQYDPETGRDERRIRAGSVPTSAAAQAVAEQILAEQDAAVEQALQAQMAAFAATPEGARAAAAGRLLGEQTPEEARAAAIAAELRRRLGGGDEDEDEDGGGDGTGTPRQGEERTLPNGQKQIYSEGKWLPFGAKPPTIPSDLLTGIPGIDGALPSPPRPDPTTYGNVPGTTGYVPPGGGSPTGLPGPGAGTPLQPLTHEDFLKSLSPDEFYNWATEQGAATRARDIYFPFLDASPNYYRANPSFQNFLRDRSGMLDAQYLAATLLDPVRRSITDRHGEESEFLVPQVGNYRDYVVSNPAANSAARWREIMPTLFGYTGAETGGIDREIGREMLNSNALPIMSEAVAGGMNPVFGNYARRVMARRWNAARALQPGIGGIEFMERQRPDLAKIFPGLGAAR